MNTNVFARKTSHQQRSRVDRFVLPRETFADERRRRVWRGDLHNDIVDIWETKHQKQKKYKKYLDEVFGLKPTEVQRMRGAEEDAYVQPWPCAPRRRGHLSSVESILDLPAYSSAVFPEILDWSSRWVLVAALGNHYYMYNWDTQAVKGQGVTTYKIHCCKFDPSGDMLLTGSLMMTVELHDCILGKKMAEGSCICLSQNYTCAITAVDWSPTGYSFVSGCSRGRVKSYDRRTFHMIGWKWLATAPVLTVKISPDARYVAAVTLNSPLLHLLIWPSLEFHSNLDSNGTNNIVKSIAWHPWRSALLGVGVKTAEFDTNIAMWNTPSSQLRTANLGHYNLDVMLFSHRTGELVLGLWNSARTVNPAKSGSQIVVMSDPYTVVDQSGESKNRLDRVRTMVFSPDGTKLATATADEDLIIWNFLPEDKKKKNTNPRRFSAGPAYLDYLTQGFVLR